MFVDSASAACMNSVELAAGAEVCVNLKPYDTLRLAARRGAMEITEDPTTG